MTRINGSRSVSEPSSSPKQQEPQMLRSSTEEKTISIWGRIKLALASFWRAFLNLFRTKKSSSVLKGRVSSQSSGPQSSSSPASRQPSNYSDILHQVELDKEATQYSEKNFGDQRPPACTLHAFAAIREIMDQWDNVVAELESNDSKALSERQLGIIRQGIEEYGKLERHQAGGWNLQDFARYGIQIPNQLSFQDPEKENAIVSMPSMGMDPEEGIKSIILDHFTNPGEEFRYAWIKNNNDESMALIGKGNQVILFDSHRSRLSLIDLEKVQGAIKSSFLYEKLTGEGEGTLTYGLSAHP